MAVADTAASLQQQYDQAVHEHGADSAQALEAEREAQQFFKGTHGTHQPAFNESE